MGEYQVDGMEKPNHKKDYFCLQILGRLKEVGFSSISSIKLKNNCFKPCQWLQLHVCLVSVGDVLRRDASHKKSLSISLQQLCNCKLCCCRCFCCYCCCCCCFQRGLAIPDYEMVHKWCVVYFELFLTLTFLVTLWFFF